MGASINHNRLQTKNGFSLVELVVATAVLPIAIIALSWIIISISQRQAQQNLAIAMARSRAQLQNLLANDLSWSVSVSKNPIMNNCLTSGAGCSAVANPVALALWDQNANLIYDSSDPNVGFNQTGAVCSSYNANSAGCNLKVQLNWIPQCDKTGLDPYCLSPYIQINGTYLLPEKLKTWVNVASYNFNFGRSTARAPSSISTCPSTLPAGCLGTLICRGPPPAYWECDVFNP